MGSLEHKVEKLTAKLAKGEITQQTFKTRIAEILDEEDGANWWTITASVDSGLHDGSYTIEEECRPISAIDDLFPEKQLARIFGEERIERCT